MERVAVGAVTRTGSVVLVALDGVASAPRFASRSELSLLPGDLPSQPYHVAAGLDLADGEDLISKVERAAEAAAEAALRALADRISATVLGVGVVVKAVSVPERLSDVLRSHAWMHAAEGVFYREAVLAAARECGWPAHAVDATRLPAAQQQLDAIASAAGRPWRRIEKDAARAAMAVLPTLPGSS
ncbi:MAG: hypothetical protein LBV34_10175, partial [Nocardiopsaceae bacterium]|nr:hypothetical protein [Nocardiopsaceae bacterium]